MTSSSVNNNYSLNMKSKFAFNDLPERNFGIFTLLSLISKQPIFKMRWHVMQLELCYRQYNCTSVIQLIVCQHTLNIKKCL
jgi:hypothetical protein